MSVFTTVTPDELSAWLLRYSIGSLLHLEGIAAGIENTNYFVTTTQGRYVLTLFEKIKAHELPFYLNLMAHLADRGIPCPRPIASSSNEYLGHLNGKPAALVTCIKGADVKTAGARECSVVGKLLGDLHLAGQGYGPTMPNPRGPQWWHAAARQVAPFQMGPRTGHSRSLRPSRPPEHAPRSRRTGGPTLGFDGDCQFQ